MSIVFITIKELPRQSTDRLLFMPLMGSSSRSRGMWLWVPLAMPFPLSLLTRTRTRRRYFLSYPGVNQVESDQKPSTAFGQQAKKLLVGSVRRGGHLLSSESYTGYCFGLIATAA